MNILKSFTWKIIVITCWSNIWMLLLFYRKILILFWNDGHVMFILITWLQEILCLISGKGRLYPTYSLSGSEGEDIAPSIRNRAGYPPNNHPTNQAQHNHFNTSSYKQQRSLQQQHPFFHLPGSGAGLSDTPTSGNASDETLTDCELTNLARESTLLVHNGKFLRKVCTNYRLISC